ncbi:Sec7 domain [Dillenia turbinata]|uniref:Sec7 domain n=1 Tax=Dillenia turbinata TaxID=194707 RepID=A0AAN8Z121_9MAGN
MQKGISLFNWKPSKGIEFLVNSKKIGGSPEEVASFLKNTSGLNEAMMGDYLGDREDFPLKVMHAYVDSFNFSSMDFGEAIRFFLRGFRLPGEAQKIDRIMEKFAERYCKCNPHYFTSADTAYVLAYSVIMLNTDAHNSMVKDKMTKADFIHNNRGIDDGKDLPENYLGALYDQIVTNEIKMNADSSAPQSKQPNSLNKLLGLDGILNLVTWKQAEEKPLGANGFLIRHIQEQFKAKSGRTEDEKITGGPQTVQQGSAFYPVSDAAILRFIIEVCWGPMLAAFSMTLDQSDDKAATSQCLQGFRHAVHVTAVMGMQTQRDAFVSTVAKFTYLHCAADMKQKNVDAVKTIMSIAIEDGNYLQEAWEHILTCLSRFEHLQLLGEGVPPDASFFTASNVEVEEKSQKATGFPNLKKKGTLQNPVVMAVVRGDGSFELNHIFAHSQRLNSEAIVAFVKALCKVSISELQSPTDPRVFSLTKIVEIAHYNMNQNLSVAIYVMDSLRQLAMKFLEREELGNYNFQNEFLRPFVIVMQKSNSAEIRELIVRCISQIVLSHVNNVKSGWKSVFMVFTAAAADVRKNIVMLAFGTMEKIVKEYFPYITETETVTFTDCVRCLITFTNSRFSSDVSLSAISFLRFCAIKLAEGGLVCDDESKDNNLSRAATKGDAPDVHAFADKDDHASFWVPLLSGLSKLTSDPCGTIRKSALEVLFNILKDHGHLFSWQFWNVIFNSVIFPSFNSANKKRETWIADDPSPTQLEGSAWDSETSAVAAEILLPEGVAALVHLAGDLCRKLSEDEWRDIFLALKEAAASTLPGFLKALKIMDSIEVPDVAQAHTDVEVLSDNELTNDDLEDDNLQTAAYVVSRVKNHISVQLQIIQVATDLYQNHRQFLSAANVNILISVISSIASHAHQLNSERALKLKLQKTCSILELHEPRIVHFENESYHKLLNFLKSLTTDNPHVSNGMNIKCELVEICKEIMEIYLKCAGTGSSRQNRSNQPEIHWILPLISTKKELAARTALVVSALRVLSSLDRESFRRYVTQFFPMLVDLVRCEHSSGEVPRILSNIFQTCIDPIMMEL